MMIKLMIESLCAIKTSMDDSHDVQAINTASTICKDRPAPIKKKPTLAFTISRSISVSYSADEIMKSLMECAQK